LAFLHFVPAFSVESDFRQQDKSINP